MHAHVLQHRMLHAALEPVCAEGALMTDIVAVDVVLSGIFICACKKNEMAGTLLAPHSCAAARQFGACFGLRSD